MKNPIVTIKMKSDKLIKLELYPDKAPNTVNNFIYLVKKGFYNNLIFHRVIENFMIQGGDPEGKGIGGPGYSIKGEFANNGIENDLNHTAGVISMARSQHMDSAGSQFFIMHKDAPHLDGSYAAFGRVIEGMDEVDRIAKTETDFHDKPLKDEKMISLVVDTFGFEYPEPQKISD
jgi:peptidyl-prolyl cis-trans isomerase B (cyclophilin B)